MILIVLLDSSDNFEFFLQANASLKSDKESLETALYEMQQTAGKLETRKEQLEGESQELRLAKEALSVDIARVRKEREIEESRLNRQIEALEQKMTAANRDHEVFSENFVKLFFLLFLFQHSLKLVLQVVLIK